MPPLSHFWIRSKNGAQKSFFRNKESCDVCSCACLPLDNCVPASVLKNVPNDHRAIRFGSRQQFVCFAACVCPVQCFELQWCLGQSRPACSRENIFPTAWRRTTLRICCPNTGFPARSQHQIQVLCWIHCRCLAWHHRNNTRKDSDRPATIVDSHFCTDHTMPFATGWNCRCLKPWWRWVRRDWWRSESGLTTFPHWRDTPPMFRQWVCTLHFQKWIQK